MKRVVGFLGLVLLFFCTLDVTLAKDNVQVQWPKVDDEIVTLRQFIKEISAESKINFIIHDKSLLNHQVRKRKFNSILDILKTTLAPYNKGYIYNDSGDIVAVQVMSLKQNVRDDEISSSDSSVEDEALITENLNPDVEIGEDLIVITSDAEDVSDVQSNSNELIDVDTLEIQDVDTDSVENEEVDTDLIEMKTINSVR